MTALPAPSLALTRLVLIGVNLIGSLSFLLELYFIRHFNEPLQWVALIATIAGLIGGLVAFSPNPLARGLVALVGLGMVGVGGLGFIIHLTRNLGYANGVLGDALRGPTPVLAPLSLANVGLLLLVSVWLGSTNRRVTSGA